MISEGCKASRGRGWCYSIKMPAYQNGNSHYSPLWDGFTTVTFTIEIHIRGKNLYIETGPCSLNTHPTLLTLYSYIYMFVVRNTSKIMGSTWGPPGSCRPRVGPMLAPWILLSVYPFCQGSLSPLICHATGPKSIVFSVFATWSIKTSS